MSGKTRVFLICPVRNCSKHDQNRIKEWVSLMEERGNEVHWPQRDTPQNDPTGYQICCTNRKAMRLADYVAVYWTPDSEGTLFDLGMAFALNCRMMLINKEDINKQIQPGQKSFAAMLKHYVEVARFWQFCKKGDSDADQTKDTQRD